MKVTKIDWFILWFNVGAFALNFVIVVISAIMGEFRVLNVICAATSAFVSCILYQNMRERNARYAAENRSESWHNGRH